MTGLGISSLPLPADAYRVDLPYSANYFSRFETEEASHIEDVSRAAKAKQAAQKASKPDNRIAAEALAYKLDYQARGDDPPESAASRSYMRDHRMAIIGSLSQTFDPAYSPNACTATILRADWEMSPSQFRALHPSEIMNPLRMDLYRSGARDAVGAMFAGLHAEHEPRAGQIRVHAHVVADGGMVDVVRRLRVLPLYAPIIREHEGVTKRVPTVRVTRIREGSLSDPLSYTVQSFIPSRWEGVIDGKWCRSKMRTRVVEPVHTQILLWLDQWRLEDLTMQIGLKVSKQGLVRTRPFS